MDTLSTNESADLEGLARRLVRIERHNWWLLFALLILSFLIVVSLPSSWLLDRSVTTKTVTATETLELFDQAGNVRMYVHLEESLPRLRLVDSSGEARMAIGLDGSGAPFLELADASGQKRASLRLNEAEGGAVEFFDEFGTPGFIISQ